MGEWGRPKNNKKNINVVENNLLGEHGELDCSKICCARDHPEKGREIQLSTKGKKEERPRKNQSDKCAKGKVGKDQSRCRGEKGKTKEERTL